MFSSLFVLLPFLLVFLILAFVVGWLFVRESGVRSATSAGGGETRAGDWPARKRTARPNRDGKRGGQTSRR